MARRWLEGAGVAYHFHDYRKDGLQQDTLVQWVDELGWEMLLNRRGSTWRKLPEKEKLAINAERAITLMLEQPTMIKRPLLDMGGQKLLGFSEEQYSNLLS